MGKIDDIIFDKPTITIEDYPEIMWKTITTDKYVKRRRITVTIRYQYQQLKKMSKKRP